MDSVNRENIERELERVGIKLSECEIGSEEYDTILTCQCKLAKIIKEDDEVANTSNSLKLEEERLEFEQSNQAEERKWSRKIDIYKIIVPVAGGLVGNVMSITANSIWQKRDILFELGHSFTGKVAQSWSYIKQQLYKS